MTIRSSSEQTTPNAPDSICSLDYEAKKLNCYKFSTWSELNSLIKDNVGLQVGNINIKSGRPLVLTSKLDVEQIVNKTFSSAPKESLIIN